MDNAKIYIYGKADILDKLLWDTVVDGRPLRILILYLPTRSPELNPIELIFHILSRRIRSFREVGDFVSDNAVVYNATRVLNDISFNLVQRTIDHCGYISINDQIG